MQFLLSLLILAAPAPAPNEPRAAEAIELFHCRFDANSDRNYDSWPDGWLRQRGRGFPLYVNIEMVDESAAGKDGGLRFTLNGAAAAILSPAVPVESEFSYVLTGRVRTRGLKNDRATMQLIFYDANDKPLETITSPAATRDTDWRELTIGPLSPSHASARYAMIRLGIEPQAPADLRGTVVFDEIRLARIPRMIVTTDRRDNFYTLPAQPQIRCDVSGFTGESPNVTFELLDVDRRPVLREELQIQRAPQRESKRAAKPGDPPRPGSGHVVWKPKLPQVGHYYVRTAITDGAALIHRQELSLAIVERQDVARGGEFGWSVPHGDQSLPLAELADVAARCGINWIKFPMWPDPKAERQLDEWALFAERLSFRGIELVGLLCPPAQPIEGEGPGEPISAAGFFTTPMASWYPTIEPVLLRMGLKVRHWQLGLDKDTSFIGYPKLAETIRLLHDRLARFGQHIELGFGWRWLDPLPVEQKAPWSFVALSGDPALTAEELQIYLARPSTPGVRRWIVLEPLPQGSYSLATRTTDLIQQMVSAKRNRADAIFLPDAFDAQQGLFTPDGTPGELLLPWRTTALALAGAEYLGSMQLPGGSVNHVFARDGQAIMVIWSDSPRVERLFLGENIWQVSPWGRSKKVPQEGADHLLSVDVMPTIITGLNEGIARMRIGFAFEKAEIPSIFGRPHENRYRLINPFKQSISGRVKLLTPDPWRTSPKTAAFKLAPGESVEQFFEVTLPYDATTGKQTVSVELEFTTDRRYSFGLQRTLSVGGDDVVIDVSTRVTEQSEVEVQQLLLNNTDQPLSFRCQLFIPDRRTQVTQVLDQRRGSDKKIYFLPKADELIGKTLWLRAEEIGGARILNYRFTVSP